MDGYKTGDTILDRYEVTDTLGQGGMGYVLAAHDRRLDRPVALKFLLASLRDKPHVAARFEREARTATRIVDEHVARVHNVEVTPDGVPFIVMEHLRGEDLASVLRKRGPLRIDEAVDVLLQAGEAIAQAHKLGIVHRDLKPSNLFLTKTFDGTPILKVLDFGIAKALTSDDTALTATDAFVGSPGYMSPEQLEAGEVDARSDVWALGVIFYELVAGTPPFTGPSVPVICSAILHEPYTDLSSHRPDVPEALEDAVAEALCKDPEWRIPSVEAFAAKLAPFGTEAARASYACIRRIASATAAPEDAPKDSASAPAPLATAGETSVDRPTSLTPTPPPPSPPPRPRRSLQLALGTVATAALVLGLVRYGVTLTRSSAAASAPASAASTSAASALGCSAGATPGCEAACAAEDPGSCGDLAKALAKGVGAPQDLARAAALFQSDCDDGSGDSCNRLAGLVAHGEGVPQNDGKAFNLYDEGCRKGSAAACVNEGDMLFDGKGVPKDEATAAPLFLRGCEGGELLGCVNVSVAYHDGKGVPKDLERAYEFAERACTGGALAGCTHVAAAKVLGEGVAKDVKGGLAQLDGLCKRGETTACEKAAAFATKGVGTDVPADSLRVRQSFAKGCVAGSEQDCHMKRTLDTQDKTSGTSARGWALFQTQCDNGMMSACRMLGESLVSGTWGVTDKPKGTALLEKACKGGDKLACKKAGDGGGR